MLADPVDRLLSWLDEVQVGGASFARLVGIADVPPDRTATGEEPEDDWLRAHDVRYAYVPGRDVLHGIGLDLEPGERIAVVGPSGAGKSTLGRLLAGNPPARGPARSRSAACRSSICELDTLRREVALVTQEQHVFVGTLADNLRLARAGSTDDELLVALDAVDATEWMQALPDGLETVVGAGGASLTPAQTQQLALARLVLADPHTLVLDEATSLLDPRAARHLERSLASVLTGPHGRRDRPPPPHGARRRSRRGGRGRATAGARHPRRADRERRRLRGAVGELAVLAAKRRGSRRAPGRARARRPRGARRVPSSKPVPSTRLVPASSSAPASRVSARSGAMPNGRAAFAAGRRERILTARSRSSASKRRPTIFVSARALPPTASASDGLGGLMPASARATASAAALI